MRVGLDVSPITTSRTGVGNYCLYLLKHLMALGEDCAFSGFSSGLGEMDLAGFGGALHHRHVGLPTRVLYLVWNIFGAPRVDGLLGGLDVFHATNYFLPPVRDARRVVTIHDLSFMAVPELCSPRIVGPFARGVRRFCREADAILADSGSTKADIERFLEVDPAKITVAPIAVEDGLGPMDRGEAARRVEEGYGVGGPFLLFVSTLEPRKNVVGLIRAFELLAKDFPHSLVLVGPVGWNANEMFGAIERSEFGGRVHRTGFVSQGDLRAFYSAADVFVFPTHYEGFGLPLLEAMVCGCPVVTSDNSSVPEVTGEGALRCDSYDMEGFAALVGRVLSDGALRDSLVEKGREQAAGFSWERCARITMESYKKLASC